MPYAISTDLGGFLLKLEREPSDVVAGISSAQHEMDSCFAQVGILTPIDVDNLPQPAHLDAAAFAGVQQNLRDLLMMQNLRLAGPYITTGQSAQGKSIDRAATMARDWLQRVKDREIELPLVNYARPKVTLRIQ